MTVDDFLWRFVKFGTPVTITDSQGEVVDSFIWKEGVCAWEGNREVNVSTIADGRLIIKTFGKIKNNT